MPTPELDQYGQWIGPCEKCGTNHDGYPPNTFGGDLRCVRTQAMVLGLPSLVAEADEAMAILDRARDDFLRDEGLID